jgi:hypothetical protein
MLSTAARRCIVRVAILRKQDAMTERTTIFTRLKKFGLFVAIVWGIAGTFVVFDIVATSGMDRLAGAFDEFDALSVPDEVRQSATCGPSNGDKHDDRVTNPVVQAAAWSLGVQVGAHARWTESLSDALQSQSDPRSRAWLTDVQRMVQQTDAEVTRLAAALNVPRPTAFAQRNRATAPRDFVTFVEADAQATARGLARNHAPPACEAYKMGEYWGYSMMSRDILPGERNVFAAEISHYATRLQVPETLWRPMVARTPSDATTAQLTSETLALTNALTKHLGAAKQR